MRNYCTNYKENSLFLVLRNCSFRLEDRLFRHTNYADRSEINTYNIFSIVFKFKITNSKSCKHFIKSRISSWNNSEISVNVWNNNRFKEKLANALGFFRSCWNVFLVDFRLAADFVYSIYVHHRSVLSACHNSYVLIYANRISTRYRFMGSVRTCQRVYLLVLSTLLSPRAGVSGLVPTRLLLSKTRHTRHGSSSRSERKRATLVKPV